MNYQFRLDLALSLGSVAQTTTTITVFASQSRVPPLLFSTVWDYTAPAVYVFNQRMR